jgi:hypothetical protein
VLRDSEETIMITELTIAEPIEKVLDDWDFFADSIVGKFSAFREVGQNIYGIRRRSIGRAEIVDTKKGSFGEFFEMGAHGSVAARFEPMRLHVTTAGTPHRVPHSMGFWHINDMDELYLPLPSPASEPLGHFLVIMQTPSGNEGESFTFYCEQCLTLLYELHYATGKLGMHGMFKAEEVAVREFNADPGKRTCPECGHVNPFGYCWNTAKDTPDERAARAIW